MSRTISKNGFNVPSHQLGSEWYPSKTESVIIPSSSLPAFGAYFTIDYKELGTIIHDATIQFNYSALTGTTVTNFIPAYFHPQRIEFVQNGNVLSTNYPTEQFILNNLFKTDEERKMSNQGAGLYDSSSQRIRMAGSSYYLDLFAYFQMCGGIPVLENTHQIQIRNYMNNLVDITAPAGSPIATINSVNLIAKITRLRSSEVDQKRMEIMKRPQHYKFNELRFMSSIIPTSTTSTTVVLTGITGRVGMLFFVIRSAASLANAGFFAFNAISSYSILDSSSTNISGGQDIPNAVALTILPRDWIESSYLCETALGATNNSANVYVYSFATDPANLMKYGISSGHWNFTGNEQLKINFASATGSASTLEVYAYGESVIEVGRNSVNKKNFQ